ncbi:MAG: VCBS repeat-containing protein [Planctomycetota bacterium]|jgi:hypothetical protein|nr:VCBS repeat-containing protein [Planctomycetota bacterium]
MLPRFQTSFVLLGLLMVAPLLGVINPSLQPRHLVQLYDHVAQVTVTELVPRELRAVLRVDAAAKGDLTGIEIELLGEDKGSIAELLTISKGQQLVLFAGKSGRRRSVKRDALLYVGSGTWFKLRMGEKGSAWTLLGSADEGVDAGSAQIMFATFNGGIDALWRLVSDVGAGRGYFPSTPFTRFDAQQVATVPGAGGIACGDWNHDGRVDLVIAGRPACQLLLNQGEGRFAAGGSIPQAGDHVAVADLNADGRDDVVIDGVIAWAGDDGAWTVQEVMSEAMLGVQICELSGDGRPDLLFSVAEGGLRAFVNDSSAGMTEQTSALGLDRFAGLSGPVAQGDWNGDAQVDFVYLAEVGYLLVRSGATFDVQELSDEGGMVAAALAPIIDPTRPSCITVGFDGQALFANQDGKPRNVTGQGNEIQDEIPDLGLVVAEDLNADGTCDILALSSVDGSQDLYLDNRGYGSFMLPNKYASFDAFPAAVFKDRAKRGVLVADLNDDGANDVVISDAQGGVWLCCNQTLAHRGARVEVDTVPDERTRIESRLVSVVLPPGPGTVNARLTLLAADGRVLDQRFLASHGQTVLVSREPGQYTVQVTFSDGRSTQVAVDGTAGRHCRVDW